MTSNVYLTYDYEIFFDLSGTPENSILKPTDLLMNTFKETGIKATFFVDVLYYKRLLDENNKTREQAKLIKDQLQRLIANDHRIELHLHPHWMDAQYDSGHWRFPSYRNYRLASLSSDTVIDLFKVGTEILNHLARKVDTDYCICAFRAGGWCIQPFDKIKKGFNAAGIKIDSSVGYGVCAQGIAQKFNFINAPQDDLYRFENDPLQKQRDGSYWELPITTYEITLFQRIINKLSISFSKRYSEYGDGRGISPNYKGSRIFSYLDTLKRKRTFLSLDRQTSYTLNKAMSCNLLKNYVIVSHCKFVCPQSLTHYHKLADLPEKKFKVISEENLQT